MARIAARGPSFAQKVKEIVAMVRAFFRRMGWANLAQYNDTDIAHILANARKAIPRGVSIPARATMFRVAPAPALSPKIGPLDTPMRLALQKNDALAVWRGAFRLLEKTAGAALDNRVGEIIKAGLIDRYGLSDAVLDRNQQMRLTLHFHLALAARGVRKAPPGGRAKAPPLLLV